jgi:oligo-1,6-glucosidase
MGDPGSVLHHYRRVIALRHSEPVVAEGGFEMLLPEDDNVYAFTRSLDDVTLLVLGNFSAEIVEAAVPDAASWAQAELVLGNYPTPEATSSHSVDAIALRPWEARVYRRLT